VSRTNRAQIAIGAASLATGILVYLAVRPAGSVWFLPPTWHLDIALPNIVRHSTGQVPTFTHVLAFSLFSSGVVASRRREGAIICMGWFLLESAFEIGQRHNVSVWLVPWLPSWFDHVWLLANARTFFAWGTFDPLDLAAAAAGAAMAYFIISRTQPEGIPS